MSKEGLLDEQGGSLLLEKLAMATGAILGKYLGLSAHVPAEETQPEEFIIDIEHVGDPNWGPECCIYKVPKRLSKVKEQAYTPKLISIGPVHHNKGELKDMQKRNFFLPPDQKRGKPIVHRHSATKLDNAGLIFENRKGQEKDRHLLHVEFQKDNKTEDLFRNLMALEQCHYPKEAYICNYILLLDFLINNKDDVELLVEEGIIVNSLGSNKAVADMVNKLGQEIVEKNSYYHDVAKDLNKYYRNWWNKNMESLKTVYFRDIWRGTATVVGIIVLVVTVLNFLRPFVFKHI
ncbi:hypothetical protein CMV_016014 [Castanea mollissima]|uniref:Uncharacterized protein n=1 Tax=Castanea mollissima TaxID=60419 RepID=A0A8J4VS38_9ROSI|nr:hypothetical protein CMV_016014 [Castanea mollissima]